MLSVPDIAELDSAPQKLDLMVSLDLYANETNRHADYILAGTTFQERDDMPMAYAAYCPTVFLQAAEPVLEPYGQARPEWGVFEELAARMNASLLAIGPYGGRVRFSPQRAESPTAEGQSARYPCWTEHAPHGGLRDVVALRDGKVCLAPA
ncbi:MAG: molybdopterin-dependent oxidoreductase [Mycobacterium sp.]|nr:molybdopterin-dependent oxidoreductase [Mycobacterium sp.]